MTPVPVVVVVIIVVVVVERATVVAVVVVVLSGRLVDFRRRIFDVDRFVAVIVVTLPCVDVI